ncbi:MAG: lipopolysaccharide kinase InaA family protein [Planctomycetota bacterium]
MPEGFEAVRADRGTAVVRSSVRADLAELGVFDRERLAELRRSAEPVGSGRGGAVAAPLPTGGGRVIIRHCHRGGLLRGLAGDRHLLGARPIEELCVTEAARAAGVPAPEPLAAIVWRRSIGYSGDLVVREIPGATSLEDWLSAGPDAAQRRLVIGRLAEAFSRLVGASICHPDLHAGNVLVQDGVDGGLRVYLIDFDRAKRVDGGLSARRRNVMLFRFNRALVKRGLAPRPVTPLARMRFIRKLGIAPDAGARRKLFSDCAAHLRRHAWHYGRSR